MAAKKPAAKKRIAKKPAAKKPAAKKTAAAKPIAKKAAAPVTKTAPSPKKAAATKPAAGEKPAKTSSPKRDPSLGPVVKTRVVIPMDVYEPNKDTIKAPFKKLGMKWNFLGEGKGLYKRDRDVHAFTQFKDDGVHYSVWGDDKKAVDELLSAWKTWTGPEAWATYTTAGESAGKAEEQEKESEALRLWKLGEPQARPGEPAIFLEKRKAEWLAKKPA